ncbi:MAG: molybdopterin molybdotransferase MoeA [Thermoflexales bacterium]|nr:molybdopterin molybdotransferase MoeA [Thermoflexales bacterium]
MRTLNLLPPVEAMARLSAALAEAARALGTEIVPTLQAHNRVLAMDVRTPTDMPEFRRSAVDGFAVKADSTPGVLRVIGEVRMGELCLLAVRTGEAVRVPTGGHVPEGADAVLAQEQARSLSPDVPSEHTPWKIQTSARLTPGENVINQGEDLRAGDVAIPAGRRLREQEIAGLLALGVTQVEVRRKPRVAIIASGDELVPAEAPVRPGQVRNINAPMLSALVVRNGGEPLNYGILPDTRDAFEQAARRAMHEADVIVFTAGSSVGERDFVPEVVAHLGKPGVLAHGIYFRPGKPTLFAVCDGKPLLGLPGNPISTLVTGLMFLAPTLWRVQGADNPPQPNRVKVILTRAIKSPRDLEHWIPVVLNREHLEHGTQPVEATPTPIKSNLIFGLVRATGLICAPIGVEMLEAGSVVEARLLE